MYDHAIGVAADMKAAIEWYEKAVKQGNPWAEGNLGDCYFEGRGVDKDYAMATKLFRSAADKGNEYAAFMLAICYHEGLGVPRDPAVGNEYYKRAALGRQRFAQEAVDLGHPVALWLFGERTERRIRRYLEPDDIGLEFYEWAAAHGHDSSRIRAAEIKV